MKRCPAFEVTISSFRLLIVGGGNSAINAQIEDLSNQLMESKLTIEGLEKERDFYFTKLRDIEVLAQEHENDGGEFVTRALQVTQGVLDHISKKYLISKFDLLGPFNIFINDFWLGTLCYRRRIRRSR